MTDLKENERLRQENEALRRKLVTCAIWMRRQVEEQICLITRRKVTRMAVGEKENFLEEHMDEVISKRIKEFFGEIFLLNAPKGTIDHLVHSEIAFFNLRRNPNIDGFSVIGGYQKILDACIEHMIIMDFRKFAKKQGCVYLRSNDPLEKALHSVVNRDYILSIGRLYGLLKMISEHKIDGIYAQTFELFIQKSESRKRFLLDQKLLSLLRILVESDTMGSKRHEGFISLSDTEKSRRVVVGDFSDTNCLLYRFLEYQSVTV